MTQDKQIINTFQQRRQLEEAMAALAQIGSERDLVQAVRQIVDSFSGADGPGQRSQSFGYA